MKRIVRFFLLAIPWLGTWLVHREARAQGARARSLFEDLNDIKFERLEVRDSEIVMSLAKDCRDRPARPGHDAGRQAERCRISSRGSGRQC